jgi:hypothetical protein
MPAVLLCAHFTDQELTQRKQARRTLPDPAATARALALAICEVEAGLRSASQLERICHPSLWDAVASRIQRATSQWRQRSARPSPGVHAGAGGCGGGGPPWSAGVFMALRLEAVPGRWELIELLY